MTLPLTGTASVTNGSTTVVVSGFALSKLTVIAGTTVYLAKVPYFVLSVTDTTTLELDEPYAGATNAAVAIKVNQIDAAKAATVTLNSAIAAYSARLALLDADGKGLFYQPIGMTGANDPGPGKIGRNNADWALTTALYVDVLDAAGRDVSGLIDLWAAGTVVIVRSLATGGYVSFKMGSTASNEGPNQWRKLVGLTFVERSGAIADGEDVAVDWKINGEGLHIDATGAFAGRAAFDGQPVPFAYVSTNGSGAETFARIYFKQSATSGDWSAGVPFQGPKGDKGDTGDPSTVPGITWKGTYSGATAYVVNDGVKFNGSSFRNILAGAGVAPSSASPPADNTSWIVVAAKGTDGAGTGDVIGPSSATDLRVAVFDGDGKHIKDGGKTIAELVPAGYDDLLLSVSLLALQVADNTNVALFLGASGNRVADSFDALTYVDVAGGTNLDSATPGVLKPTLVPVGLSYLAGTEDATDQTTYTFAAQSFGAAAADRHIAVAISTRANAARSISSVTIGGVAATPAFVANNAASGADMAAIYVANVPTGATGSVVVVMSAAMVRCAIAVYRMTGLNSATPVDTAGVAVTSAAPSVNLDVVAGGPVIGALKAAVSSTWSYLTENFDAASTEASGDAASFASVLAPSTVLNQVVTDTLSGSSVAALAVASWAPSTTSFNNLTVRSASFTAATAPAKMKALIRVKEVDAATAGTDYTLECSRDGGTTWATMTLTELFTSPSPTSGIRVVEAAETDVSAQPSGTAPRWRFKTLNTKNVELHDVYFYWS